MAHLATEDTDVQHARKLIDIYGGGADDFFKFWPRDKTYFFSKDKRAFIAYGVKRKVAVCMGDPIGREQSIGALLREFNDFCLNKGWLIAFIQTSNKYQTYFEACKLRSIIIGADALIDLDRFTQSTVHNKYFRNINNRFKKGRFNVTCHIPPHSKTLLNELRHVSLSWSKLPHRKEWSFLTGRFDNAYLQQVTIRVLRDANGKAQAFVNELPSFEAGVSTVDLMRHRADAPPNGIDYLFICLLQDKRTEGYASFNLGMSPLDGMQFTSKPMERLLQRFYKISDRFIGFKGLHQFKAKYDPDWLQRYVWYSNSPIHLVRIGRAVYDLLMGL